MSNINLLPWREEDKRKRKTVFFVALMMSFLLVLVSCYATLTFIDLKIKAQNTRNQFLQTEVLILDKKITEISLIKKEAKELKRHIHLIQKLERKRDVVTHLFNSLPDITPTGIYLTSVSLSNNQIKITGLTESNEKVSDMVRKIEQEKWLTDVSLPSIISGPTKPIKLSKFSMNFSVLSKKGSH